MHYICDDEGRWLDTVNSASLETAIAHARNMLASPLNKLKTHNFLVIKIEDGREVATVEREGHPHVAAPEEESNTPTIDMLTDALCDAYSTEFNGDPAIELDIPLLRIRATRILSYILDHGHYIGQDSASASASR